jgi:hypothetical protein
MLYGDAFLITSADHKNAKKANLVLKHSKLTDFEMIL